MGAQVVLAGELVTGFNLSDGIGFQVVRPIGKVAVDLNPLRGMGDGDGTVVTIRRVRSDQRCHREKDQESAKV